MLFDCVTGVSGFGLVTTLVQSGITNRVKFSYNANSRSIRAGVCSLSLDSSFAIFVWVDDFEYADMVLLSSPFTVYR